MQKLVNVHNHDIAIIEWNGERVITTAQLADVYGTDINNVQNNFNRNQDRFLEGKHYYFLKGAELKVFKSQVTISDLPIIDKFASQFYLWTKRGASRHCKILDTNEAWEQFDYLEEAYFNSKPLLKGKNLLAVAVLEAQKVIEQQDKEIRELKPKALFADAVAVSKDCILIGELAKILKQNGIDIGEKRLFKWLRKNGYLIKREGTDYNMPSQRSMDLGLFEIKETVITHSDGCITISKTAKVTGKGQQYFIKKFLQNIA